MTAAQSSQPLSIPQPISNGSAAVAGPTVPADHGRSDAHAHSQQTTPDAIPSDGSSAAPNVPQEPTHEIADPHSRCAMLLWDPLLQTLADGLDDVETVRIAQANRYRILTTTGVDGDGEVRGFGLDANHPAVAALAGQLSTLEFLEKGMVKALAKQLKSHALYPWIKAQCGLGDKQVARLLAAVRDPYWNDLHDRPRTVSELWAFSGLHVLPADQRESGAQTPSVGGELAGGGDTSQSAADTQTLCAGVAPARKRGQKINWNNEARTRIYVIAESCIKQRRSPYRAVYDDGRAKYAEAVHAVECRQCGPKGNPAPIGSDLRDGHKHARAMRLVMKAILRDLWIEARAIYTAQAAS